ncbi:MAG: hypothetical protein PHQ27_02190 [Victivallales bacterium]|nr:hypothetical protein [Victivallales bacterium]
MKKYGLVLLAVTMAAAVTAAEKHTVSGLEQKVREFIARDRRGEALESIVEREFNQRTSSPAAAKEPAVKPVAPVAIGPSRLELWQQHRRKEKTAAAPKKTVQP